MDGDTDTMSKKGQPDRSDAIVKHVDGLSEQVKDMAMNLAIYLSRAKETSSELAELEPDFIALVNSTVKAVQEITLILSAARNQEIMVYDIPSKEAAPDHLETKLKDLLNQCDTLLADLDKSVRTQEPGSVL